MGEVVLGECDVFYVYSCTVEALLATSLVSDQLQFNKTTFVKPRLNCDVNFVRMKSSRNRPLP